MEQECGAEEKSSAETLHKKILVANLIAISMVVLLLLGLMIVVFIDTESGFDPVQKVLFLGALLVPLFVSICLGIGEVDRYKRKRNEIGW